jgi:hypothetical protein
MAIQLNKGVTGGSYTLSYLSNYPASNMPNTNTAISFMGWFNSAAFALSSPIASMLGMYDGTNNASTVPTTAIQMGAGQSGTANALDVWTWGGTVLVTTGGSPGVSSTGWLHAAYTCTAISGGSQTHNIYINGALSATSTNSLQVAGTLTQIFINSFPEVNTGGSGINTYQESCNAQLDDIRLYNRQLSLQEIQTIYSLRGFRDGITYGLISRHSFNEGAVGTTVSNAIDYSSNGTNNDLAVINVNGATTAPTYAASTANNDARGPLEL